jgi:tRNA threonylcarbamoyladenosine biosynthesis protein TsaE
MELVYHLDEIDTAAKEFLKSLKEFTIVALHGNLGAGKTTFVKAVCKELGVLENISSPTFSIINQYKTENGKTIFHIDLYRLKDLEEAISAGVEESIYNADLCFIEWPEKISSILPADTVNVFIETISEDTRKMIVKLPQLNSF